MAATISGSDVKDFVSGLLMGLSVAEMLAGIVIIGNSILKKQ
jgi:2-keto-3-deoxy-galactonokinase